MSSFSLRIVTPDGIRFDGNAEKLVVRTASGDLAVLARHTNYVSALGMGRAVVEADGVRRYAACIGGMLSVMNGAVTLVPTTFEWADTIDTHRAEQSRLRAQTVLEDKDASETDIQLAQARLKRALVRLDAASRK